jgi:hypothetical protein
MFWGACEHIHTPQNIGEASRRVFQQLLYNKGKAMLSMEAILELIERLERAMRPLSAMHEGPDHDRVRELYDYLTQEESDEPLEQARLVVLQEILQPYLSIIQQNLQLAPSAVAAHVKAAIGAMVLLLCHLEEHDYDAAAASLHAVSQLLEEAHLLLRALRGDIAHA